MGLLIKLQNGDTALKSLKFGKDRPGGGSSNQPYIKNPILDEPGQLSSSDDDFLLRGGLRAPVNAAEDVARLSKYMFDFKSPSGLLFIAKQNLLSRVSPKTEASKGIGYAGGALNSGVYTPLSTLIQAGVGFTGTHVNKQGLDPTGLLPSLSINNYEDILKNQNTEENRLVNILSNSIKNLNGVKGYNINQGQDIITYDGGPGSVLGIGKTHIKYADQRTGTNNPLSSTNPKYFYNGGPVRLNSEDIIYINNVTHGLGASIQQGLTDFEVGIREDGTFISYYNYKSNYSTLSKNQQGLTLTGSNGYQSNQLLKTLTQESDTTYISQIDRKLNSYNRELLSDSKFEGGVWKPTSRYNGILPEYNSFSSLALDTSVPSGTDGEIAKGLNLSNNDGYLANLNKNSGPYIEPINGEYTFSHNQLRAGGYGIATDFRLVNRKKRGFTDPLTTYDYVTTSSDYSDTTIDKIYYDTKSDKRTSNPLQSSIDDLIDFRIKIIDPRNPNTSNNNLKFRAYIDSLSDSYSADWKSQTYMGRAEQFYKYNSFGRDISLNFTIVADNEKNLNIMYTQLNTLASSLAPTYTGFGYMAGNLHQLTVGNYVNNQTGIMNSLSYEIMDESPWEIKPGSQLPYYIKITTKFTPIHNFRPEMKWGDDAKHQFINQ